MNKTIVLTIGIMLPLSAMAGGYSKPSWVPQKVSAPQEKVIKRIDRRFSGRWNNCGFNRALMPDGCPFGHYKSRYSYSFNNK